MTDDGQLDLDGAMDRDADVVNPSRTGEPDAIPADLPETVGRQGDAPDPTEPRLPAVVDEPQSAAGEPATPAEVAPVTVRAEPRRVFYLTNRMNLNGILSSRMIAPRDSFQKYYADLLVRCPGWVPLLATRPSADLVEHVTAERGAGAPVLLELAETALEGGRSGGLVTYVRAALLADVKAIHFRDNRALREHRARTYDNVHPHDHLLQVSPELFEPDACSEVHITAPQADSTSDWRYIDRVRGAISAVVAAADSGEALAVTAGVFGVDRLPEDTVVPPWLTLAALAGGSADPKSETSSELADRLIFQTAYRTLCSQDQAQAWSPSGVLDTVGIEIAAANPGGEAQKIINGSLKRVRELVDVEREFEPFRRSDSSHVAAKALLMTLLRPDLGQLLDWPAAETGADVTTRVAAAALAGCLRGVARESDRLRNVTLDDLTAAWALRMVNGDTAGSLGSAEFASDSSKTALLLNGNVLHVSEPLVPSPVSLYEALDIAGRRSARIEISQHMHWPLEYRVLLPADSKVQQDDSMITITSGQVVTVQTWVDEQAFLGRLGDLTGSARKKVNNILTQVK